MTGRPVSERVADLARNMHVPPLLELGTGGGRGRRPQGILGRAEVSDRTLRLWLEKYRKEGFDGLLSRPRSDQGKVRSLPEDVFKEAITIKEELPSAAYLRVMGTPSGASRQGRPLHTDPAPGQGGTDRQEETQTSEGQPQIPEGTP